MSNNLTEDPIFQKLLFTKEWIETGIIDAENFIEYKNRYLEEQDSCTEHYRYAAFIDFMRSKKNLSQETFSAIYNLGKKDPDPAMGRSMRIYLIQRTDCPKKLIDLAIKDKDTSKIVLKLLEKGRVKTAVE